MQRPRFGGYGSLMTCLLIGAGADAVALAQTTQMPACTGWSDCNPGRGVCTFEPFPTYYGSTIVYDAAEGLSSDGRGPYQTGTDGVGNSWVVLGHVSLDLNGPGGSGPPRTLTLNLSNPVPGGGGLPLGIVTVRGDNLLYTSWQRIGNLARSLVSIPVGETVAAGQINVSFDLDGRFHVLQFGPQPLGHCHEGADTQVHGGGTTPGTIHRASQSRWVVNLPAGSVGRLFDASHTVRHAVDQGLYRVALHYEIRDAVPGVSAVLRSVAETQGGAAVVAHHRLLKRDSAGGYFFSGRELLSAAFWLLDSKRPEEALGVFRLSLDEYPASTHSLGGMGESFLGVGDTAKAIASLRQAVAMNPDNRRARNALQRLGVTP